ncbi:MAG: triose-phosphate isomerase, partial [Candidatus Margulisiibacteriota bacterium]
MRKIVIAGNWKMNKTLVEASDLVKKLKELVKDIKDRTIIVCPPYPALDAVSREISNSNIELGAQNLFWEDKGAYTGEVSAPMLKAANCVYVIIGHSERRQYFGETDQTVNKKIFAALKHNLFPIVCVGETLEEREANKTFDVIKKQIADGFAGLSADQWEKIIIAYEPVWAIGTGKTATPEQAQEVHAYIRGLLPKDVVHGIRILYGGSMKPDNAKELLAKPDIDGGLIGGAAL